MTLGPLFRMVEPNPKRPRLEIGALKRDENVQRSECLENGKRNEKVDVPRFECPLCMSTSEIPGNERGFHVATCQNCSQWGRGKVLCFIVL